MAFWTAEVTEDIPWCISNLPKSKSLSANAYLCTHLIWYRRKGSALGISLELHSCFCHWLTIEAWASHFTFIPSFPLFPPPPPPRVVKEKSVVILVQSQAPWKAQLRSDPLCASVIENIYFFKMSECEPSILLFVAVRRGIQNALLIYTHR